MSAVISVQNISKQYRLGQVGTGTISHDLNRWWHKVRWKEDPYLKIGEANNREQKGESDYVWALRDINFEVQQGEVLGIIGRNGAGKSTLLKILSRTTAPSTGQIKIRGRVASLLEVGTGFHPELSGRENIFLNGAILGMNRHEITRKFDEIVDFAGVERYIDTPVKRYSSGMYVRLAFGVAAHLESEILIIDEVLAVGDAEFQKKCLGKMKDVSKNEGRTVLFVSHDLSAIRKLCSRVVLLSQGVVEKTGDVDFIVDRYLKSSNSQNTNVFRQGSSEISVKSVSFKNSKEEVISSIELNQKLIIEVRCVSKESLRNIEFAICFNTLQDVRVTSLWSAFIGQSFDIAQQEFVVRFEIPSVKITPGNYNIITFINWGQQVIERIDNYSTFVVTDNFNPEHTSYVNPTDAHGFYLEDYFVSLIS
jgi:lipopolysaccharide transport system ATP-binding protein